MDRVMRAMYAPRPYTGWLTSAVGDCPISISKLDDGALTPEEQTKFNAWLARCEEARARWNAEHHRPVLVIAALRSHDGDVEYACVLPDGSSRSIWGYNLKFTDVSVPSPNA
jgi:hypothetical protein